MLVAYFDETSTDQQIACVAGYVLKARNADRMNRLWTGALGGRVPFVRMSQLAPGVGQCSGLNRDERAALASNLIAVIGETADAGFAASISVEEFAKFRPDGAKFYSPYAACMECLFRLIKIWADERLLDVPVYYCFEQGDESQGFVGQALKSFSHNKEWVQAFRYGGHSFLGKGDHRGIEAADLLAWHMHQQHRRMADGSNRRPPRKDFSKLLKTTPHFWCHYQRDDIERHFNAFSTGLLPELPPIRNSYADNPITSQGSIRPV